MLAIQLLQALAFAARKQVQEARQHLLRVLTQTHTEGFLRLFLDEGETMAALLHTLIPVTIGFLVIESPQELNVTAVYTVSDVRRSGFISIDVEQVVGKLK